MPAPRTPWLAIRTELPARRRLLLSVLSFLIPLGLWCLVAYVPPFRWHPDVKLELSAISGEISAVYTAGDRLGREFYPEFQRLIRDENAAVLAARSAGDPLIVSRRANQKLLRQLAPIGIAHGWISDEQGQDDAALYHLWRDLATGAKVTTSPELSDENKMVVVANWAVLGASSPDYLSRAIPKEALLKLVPQGRSSTPVYLPAPHEVAVAGWADLWAEPKGDKPSMWQRLGDSMVIVFGGFLLAALIGVPIGILCGTFDFVSRLVEPFVDFFRYLPAPTFSTLLVAVFLAHDAPKVALVFVGTVFQLVLVVSKTTRLLDGSLLEAAATLGANRRQLLGRVILPGILPNLYNDLRILLGWAWTWLVIAELIGVKSGLTEFIDTQGRYRNFERVFPVIILIGVVGFLTDQVLAWAGRFLFPWAGAGPGPASRALGRVVTWFPRWVHSDRVDPLHVAREAKETP
ncbi:MAG: ABC transporter permease [Planctomycetota bacterium]|jgi:NitT/TauT family transport system permease protein|nr:ABC transporter permease [Planctomycetota bacterium]